MLCFFRFLIDFDWIEGHLISDRVGSDRVSLIFLKNQIESDSDRTDFSGRIEFCRSQIDLL
jgi:hypothetical protein